MGLFGGIFNLLSGNPYSQEQSQFGSLANQQIGAGQSAQGSAENYFQNVLNNPTQALAPEISAGQGQVQQQNLENANFGNRGGGTNASTQAAAGQERGNILNMISGMQGQAAGELGSLGSQQIGQGSNALGSQAGLAGAWRNSETNSLGQIGQAVGGMLSGLPTGGSGTAASSVDPYQMLYNAQLAGNPLPTESSDTSGMYL